MAVSQSLSLTQQSQSLTDNTSVVRILWKSVQSGDSYNNYKRTAYYYVSVNGEEETRYSVTYNLPKGTTKTIVDTEIVVPHNELGEATVTVRTWMNTKISAGTVEMSKTLELTDIPRASELTLSAAEVILDGQDGSITANIIPAVEAYNHILALKFGSFQNSWELEAGILEAVIPVPMGLAALMPGETSGLAQVILQTLFGDAVIGQKSQTFTIRLEEGIEPYQEPTISGFSTERCDEDGTPNDDGAFVSVAASISYSDLGGYNEIETAVSYRLTDGGNWSDPSAFNQEITNIYRLPDDEEYEIRLSVTDLFVEVYALEILDTGEVLIEYHQADNRLEMKPHVTVPSLGLCDAHDEEKAGLHLNAAGEAYFDMGTMLQKVFSNGVWIGNDAPKDATGAFVAKDGYSGFFIDTDNRETYVVSGVVMQNVNTGDIIIRAEDVVYKDGHLTDYMPITVTQAEHEALKASGKESMTNPYLIVEG